ncbi:MAG TPA: DUF4383 domain-containing protein, partial [Chloroflexia bacterium]|nr:DUF4383 domain-containing protein [Chloroflexia bacterium]
QYAGIIGIVVLALGVVGVLVKLISGGDYLFNAINVSWTENLIHLITGGLMAYVGYGQSDVSLAKMVVGVLGVVYLLVFVISLFSVTVFGLIGSGFTWTDNIIHLVVGLLGVYVAYVPNSSAEMRV